MFVFFILLTIVLTGALTTVVLKSKGTKQITSGPRNLMLESHEIAKVWLVTSDYAFEAVWMFKCTCGTIGKTNYRESSEANALRKFKEHRDLWSNFNESERLALNASISRNAVQLDELTDISRGLSAIRSTTKQLGISKGR